MRIARSNQNKSLVVARCRSQCSAVFCSAILPATSPRYSARSSLLAARNHIPYRPIILLLTTAASIYLLVSCSIPIGNDSCLSQRFSPMGFNLNAPVLPSYHQSFCARIQVKTYTFNSILAHRRLVFCRHLITLFARSNTRGGIVRPICFAALSRSLVVQHSSEAAADCFHFRLSYRVVGLCILPRQFVHSPSSSHGVCRPSVAFLHSTLKTR